MDILRSIMVAFFILLLAACASPTKGMTTAQAEAYHVKATYEREDRRIKRHDEVFAARRLCAAHNYVWWVTGRFSSFAHRRMDRDPNWLPRNASIHDFGCASPLDTRRILDQMLGNDVWGRRFIGRN